MLYSKDRPGEDLVVRMAVLYDVLTGGPVGVRALAAAEVA